MAEARTLMRVMRAEEVIRRTLDTQMKALAPGMTDQIFRSGAFPAELANDADFRAILQRHLERIMAVVGDQTKTALPQIVEQMTAIYAREFTPAQIGDMTAFYRTPTGQALLEKTPAITADVAKQTSDLIMGPLMQTLQAE
ncbi:DUF2059 domain-containing protein, partial [Sphingomonas sp.]|uniref:DUF2059 domain-containing protein n=1 Tax=Sphingomonas sp. TaxID=28214 RepID=UPI003B3B8A3E